MKNSGFDEQLSPKKKKPQDSGVDIPVDIFDSPTEFVVVMPLGGVKKSSVSLKLEGSLLTISGKREAPSLKDSLSPKVEKCFRGEFSRNVDLPANSYFNKIQSTLTPENILVVTVPKVFVPDELTVDVQ